MTKSLLRKIEPVTLNTGDMPNPNVGTPPEIEWVVPTDLYVDDVYQRNLNEKSWRAIRRISREWDWSSYKIPNVNLREDGKLVIVDGQHTVYGAASNPNIHKIPIMVRRNMTVEQQAESFVNLNTKRIGVSPYHIFKAELAAGKQEAEEIEQAMNSVGIKLKINASAYKNLTTAEMQGFTSAIASIKKCYDTIGLMKTKYLLKCLVDCNIGVITSRQIEGLMAAVILAGKKPFNFEHISNLVSKLGLSKFDDAVREITRERKCGSKEAHRLFFVMNMLEPIAPPVKKVVPVVNKTEYKPPLTIGRVKEAMGTNSKQFNEAPKPKPIEPVKSVPAVVPVQDKPVSSVRPNIPKPMTRAESLKIFANVAQRMAEEDSKKRR